MARPKLGWATVIALSARLSPAALQAYCTLRQFTDDEGTAFPNTDKLAASERAARRLLKALVDEGLVTRTYRPGRSTLYRIALEPPDAIMEDAQAALVRAGKSAIYNVCWQGDRIFNLPVGLKGQIWLDIPTKVTQEAREVTQRLAEAIPGLKKFVNAGWKVPSDTYATEAIVRLCYRWIELAENGKPPNATHDWGNYLLTAIEDEEDRLLAELVEEAKQEEALTPELKEAIHAA